MASGEWRQPFTLGEWRVEPSRDTIARAGQESKLERKAMELLVCLSRRAGEVVTREEIEEQVWPGVIVSPQSLYQAIAQLRRALDDDPKTPRYIETVARRGYRVIAPVQWTPAAQGAPEPQRATARSSLARSARGARVPLLLAGFAAALVLAGLYFAWRNDSRSAEAGAAAHSVAVLDFADLSPRRDQGYLAAAMAEEISSALGHVDGLRVAARNSAHLASRPDATLQDIGGDLKVRYALRGSVRRVADRVRVVVTLADTETGYDYWSRTFERPAAAVAQLPADVAGAVAGAVGLVLVGDPGVRGSRVGTRSPSAYDFYMLGQQHLGERTRFSLTEAERYFQLAIEADPSFAAAYAGLADVHIAEFYFASRQLTETLDLVSPIATRALAIDPQMGAAHAIRGWMAMERGSYDEAQGYLRRAIELAPNDAKAHNWLGSVLFAQARPREALQWIDRALQLDPLNFIVHIRRALVLDALGRYDEAADAAARAVTLAPRHPNPRWTQALLATSRGDLRQAIAHYRSALELDPERSDLRSQLAMLLLDAGRRDDALSELAESARRAQSSHDYLTARAYQALLAGDQRALAQIAESLASVDPGNRFYEADAADFMVLSGNHTQALVLFAKALATDPAARLRDLWSLRLGLETPALALAVACDAAGRSGDRDEVLRHHEEFLAAAERNGVRYWGVHYHRAAAAALRRDASTAVANLELAIAAGWRRSGWARLDPSFAPLRGVPDFELLLQRVDGLNAQP